MRKTQVTLIDDMDGSNADRTVQFSLDGKSYEIDLSKTNAEQLSKALDPFIAKAAKVATSRGAGKGRGAANGRSVSHNIRLWAQDQGITVPDRGRVPAAVVAQYEAAH